jgi:hypothetical protein
VKWIQGEWVHTPALTTNLGIPPIPYPPISFFPTRLSSILLIQTILPTLHHTIKSSQPFLTCSVSCTIPSTSVLSPFNFFISFFSPSS